MATALFFDNPRAVVEGRALPYDPEPKEKQPKRGLLSRVAKLLKQQ